MGIKQTLKKIQILCYVLVSVFVFSQKYYRKTPDSEVSQPRVKLAEAFFEMYLDKCKKLDSSDFKGFTLDKRLERRMKTNFRKNCFAIAKDYGEVSVISFNSAYLARYMEKDDPVDLYIFDIHAEKNQKILFGSVWMYRDQNIVGGIYFSKEKPLIPSSVKNRKEKNKEK